MVLCVTLGLIGTPLLTFSLSRGELFGVAVMAASWWPIVLLLWFHPERRRTALRVESWFFSLVLDALALSVLFVLFLAVSKGELPRF